MKKILNYIKNNWEKILVIALSAIALIIMYLFPIIGEIKTLKSNTNNNINKRELRYEDNEYTYINLITQDLINNSSQYYYDNNNNQVSDANYRTTPRIAVSPSTIYAVGCPTQNIQITYYNSNVVRISTITVHNSTFTIPSNAYYIRVGVLKTDINSTWLYQGSVYYNYFLPDPDRLVQEYYNNGYDIGFENGYNYIAKNIFSIASQPTLYIQQGYIYTPYTGDSTVLGNGYFNPELFFTGDYLDFDYLYQAIRADGLVLSANDFMITWRNNYLIRTDNLNLMLEGSINLSEVITTITIVGELGSQTIQFTEFNQYYSLENNGLLTHIYFNRTLPDNRFKLFNKLNELQTYYNQGYNQGYLNGNATGYTDGVDYMNENVIPGIKEEQYNSGYYNGYNKGLVDGSEDFGVLGFLRSIFGVITDVLTIEILPKIKLIYIISIPLVLSVVKFVLGLFR